MKNKIKQKIKEQYLSKEAIKKSFQQEMIRCESQNAYEYSACSKTALANSINRKILRLINTYTRYLDREKKVVFGELKNNIFSVIFELAMADFFSKFSILKEHPREQGLPDLFIADHFIECTSRNTGYLKDWCDKLKSFDEMCSIVSKFCKPNDRYQSITIYLSHYLVNITPDELYELSNKLGCEPHQVEDIISEWIFLSQYVLVYYRMVIPECIVDRMKSLGLQLTTTRAINYTFYLSTIIGLIFDKLKKSYFQSDTNGIVCLFLGTLEKGLQLSKSEVFKLKDYFVKNFNKFAGDVFNKQLLSDQIKIKKGVANLSAIIIETNWYSWFGEILEEFGEANFNDDVKNTTFVIYNSSKKLEIKGHEENINKLVLDHLHFPIDSFLHSNA